MERTLFVFEGYGGHRDLHSFPTRRSSDLEGERREQDECRRHHVLRQPLAQALAQRVGGSLAHRSEEHTSELQSRQYLVCRLLLEKKKTEHLTERALAQCPYSPPQRELHTA